VATGWEIRFNSPMTSSRWTKSPNESKAIRANGSRTGRTSNETGTRVRSSAGQIANEGDDEGEQPGDQPKACETQ
jgi:hypothetical protein